MREKILQVKTFGSFSMIYDGKSLFGRKVGETQFASMMQMLIHERKKGVSRDRLEQELFGEREVENVHHALQSVIYNAKKRLEKAGLPDVNYIEIRNGVVYWNDEIKVQEDATEFDQIYNRIKHEKNPDKKIKDLEKIFEIYTGEFLVKRQSVIWVAIEARRYEDMFRECVEEAAGLYREKQNYTQLEHLGVYASNIEPFSDWEALTMEAMVALGRYEEATDLYAETAERYFEERGLKPSKRLLDSMNQLGNQVMHSYDVTGQHPAQSGRKRNPERGISVQLSDIPRNLSSSGEDAGTERTVDLSYAVYHCGQQRKTDERRSHAGRTGKETGRIHLHIDPQQ